ncbi:MAG TPA: phosphotransferase [Nocardioidaceae bacterium]|nr:phosphotransferase [Nocardioidaceae bacterium]
MSEALKSRLGYYLGAQRWFSGKGRDSTVESVRVLAWLGDPDADTRLAMCLVDVSARAGERTVSDVYQVPLSYRTERQGQIEGAYVGEIETGEGALAHVYDAVHDREAVALLVDALVGESMPAPLRAQVVEPQGTDRSGPSVVLTGEQSNTNVVVGDRLLLKVFRRVLPGRNPDIEVLDALTRAGSEEIVPLVGWLELVGDGGEPTDLAMLSEFLRMSTDGWDLALTSVRDLFAERDLHPEEVGGDFAAESHRLGATIGTLHAELAASMPTATWGPDELAAVAVRMRNRLDAALDEVPDLAEYAERLATVVDAVTTSATTMPVQRVHGDLHLGQTLRTMRGWRIIDFEGEPAKPLVERVALDTPVRDVAGMLRSFDYAAQSQWADSLGDHQLATRATEWSTRNRNAFLDGYTEATGSDPRADDSLLRAYEVDKAIYEVVYEARNRPTWLAIPLRAIARLVEADSAPSGGGS